MEEKTMIDIEKISQNATMIVCGYAFTLTEDKHVQVIDLRAPHHALLMTEDGEVLETSMDDIEISIVQDYWSKNQKLAEEVAYA